MQKKRMLISACLLGVACRYDGRGNGCRRLDELKTLAELVPVCPEIMGGLETPRVPCERKNGGVFNRDGEEKTAAFDRGAQQALKIGAFFDAELALLKQRSPSCGSREIYDGSFSGKCIPGMGVTAQLLMENGYRVFGEEQIDELIEQLREER